MNTQQLSFLKKDMGLDDDQIQIIEDVLVDVASEYYCMGYSDRQIEEEAECFVGYGKKEDWSEWEGEKIGQGKG